MQRSTAIDALKGLAISLVVAGHAIFYSGVSTYHLAGYLKFAGAGWVPPGVAANPALSLIYAVHMPLFALISGFVAWRPRPVPFSVQLEKRISRLLVPYFAWFGVYALLISAHYPSFFRASSPWWSALLWGEGESVLWFLYALFFCSIIVAAVTLLDRPLWPLVVSAVVVMLIPNVPGLPLVGARWI